MRQTKTTENFLTENSSSILISGIFVLFVFCMCKKERECGQLFTILYNVQLDLKRGFYLKDVKKDLKQGAKCSHQTLRSSECSEKVSLPSACGLLARGLASARF